MRSWIRIVFQMSLAGVLPSLRIALETLRANPLRTLLSTLGIVMGAASLAAVLSLGDGAERFAREQIEDEGLQTVALVARTADTYDGIRAPRYDYPIFSIQDGEDLARDLPGFERVSLSVQGTGLAEPSGGAKPRGVFVTGVLAVKGDGTGVRVGHGRDLTKEELRGSTELAVVSSRLAVDLTGADGESALGRTFRLQGRSCRIVGVIEGRRAQRVLMAFVPLETAQALMVPSPQPRPRTLRIEARRVEDMPALKDSAQRWLAASRPAWRDTVLLSATGEERLRQAAVGVLLFKMLMGSFTAISLLVGGIGIMNVLLASVAERTREIGIRKAVGASRRTVILQFLAESVAISIAGSVVGVAVGLLGAALVTGLMRLKTQTLIYSALSWETVAVSMLAAVAVGLAFGTYPALRAARLSPVDAITRE